MPRGLLLALVGAALLGAPGIALAQFEINGVIHDSETLAPIAGVAVFLKNELDDSLVSPGILEPPSQQGQITGPDGRYAFRIRGPIVVKIDLERPDSRFVFPSVLRPPAGTGELGDAACSVVPCPGGMIQPSPDPVLGGTYVLRFDVSQGGSARNNHVAIDDLSKLIDARLVTDRARARRGELIRFTATFGSRASETINDGTMVIDLPPEVRLRPESVRLVRRKGAVVEEQILTPRPEGLLLRYNAPPLGSGEQLELAFMARVVRPMGRTQSRARALLERSGGIGVSNEAVATLVIEEDPLLDQSTVLGQVYCEKEGGKPDWIDAQESGLYGARVYLDTGFYADSDPDGQFHFSGVPAGTRLLKLDRASLPPGSHPIGDGRAQLYLSPGTPARVRFPVDCAYEAFGEPTEIRLGKTEREAEPVVGNGTRAITLAFDPATRILGLGDRAERMMAARLEGQRTGDRLHFYPSFFSTHTPSRWRIDLAWVDVAGRSLAEIKEESLTGRGLPPLGIDRAIGAIPAGAAAVRGSLWIESGDNEWARSPPLDLLLAEPRATTPTVAVELGLVATPDVAAVEKNLGPIAAELRARTPSGARLSIEAHWDAAGGSPEAERQAQTLLVEASRILSAAGLTELTLLNRADQVPRVPNSSARLRPLNRRLRFFLAPELPKPRVIPKTVTPASLVLSVDGKDASLPITEAIAIDIELDVPASPRLTFHDGKGGQSGLVRVVTETLVARPGARTPTVAKVDGQQLQVGNLLVAMPQPWRITSARSAKGQVTLELEGGADVESWRATAFSGDGRVAATSYAQGALPNRIALSITSTVGGPRRVIVEARAGNTWATSPELIVAEGAMFIPAPGSGFEPAGEVDLDEALLIVKGAVDVAVPLPTLEELPPASNRKESAPIDPQSVAAADVTIMGAKAGEKLAEPRLPLWGRVRPGNRLSINGTEVHVGDDGEFAYTAPLPLGESKLQIESTDPEGSVAIYTRTVETSSSGWFLLGLGEAVASTGGAHLAGSNAHTRIDAGPIGLDLRLSAYGRARFAWDGPWKKISLVGRVDTAELGGPSVMRLVDDPLRLLPAFGDGSLEVQETATRHKVYLNVTADDSQLIVGNHTTELGPEDPNAYFAFRRTGFGVHADVRHSFGADDETRVRGLYADANEGVLRGHDELLGTGGSMYWFSHDELVEGSQQVTVVVRDRDTGQVLERKVLTEGADYEMRPREGRLMLRVPLASSMSAAPTGINRSVVLTGHPIYLVADYEYQASGADQRAFGAEIKERILESLEVSAALAGEDSGDSRHRLYGVSLLWEPTERSHLRFEYAQSKGRTSLGQLSVDGGLTYADLDLAPAADDSSPAGESQPFGGAKDRRAYGVSGELDVGDLARSLGTGTLITRGYARRAGLGFSALDAARDAGRLEAGLGAIVHFNQAWSARASLDGAIAALPEQPGLSLTASSMSRMLGIGGVDWQGDHQNAGLELAYLRTTGRGGIAGLPGNATGISGRYQREVLDGLTLGLAQEALLGADRLADSGASALATTLGARWDLDEHFALDAAEIVRWNGDNASQIGLRARTDDGLTGYIAERIGRVGPTQLTTIVGVEDSFGEASRTYGELQLDGGANPQQTRAVLGMDHRFRIADGVELQLAYERAQLTGRTTVNNTGSPYASILGGVTPTLGGYGGGIRDLQDSISRDALVVGGSWTPLRAVSLQGQLELRVDNGDETAGGHDFLTYGGHVGGVWQAHRDVAFLGRFTAQTTKDTIAEARWASFVEGSIGASFRPHTEDWLTVLVRLTRQELLRPPTIPGIAGVEESRTALSVEPIIDTPWRVQLVERLALLHTEARQPDGRPDSGVDVLWINRFNARIYGPLEAGVEYRMLMDLDAETAERGFLIEAGYLPDEHIRIGLGYNFTRFSDDILLLASESNAGPFLRVTARY